MNTRFAQAALAGVLLTSALLTSAAAQEEIGAKVYRDVQGCVVSLENIEGSGTGIILNDAGLILTNAHVVASPLHALDPSSFIPLSRRKGDPQRVRELLTEVDKLFVGSQISKYHVHKMMLTPYPYKRRK